MQIAHESDGLVVLSSRTMRLARGSEKMTPTFGSQKASSALVRPLITTSGIVPPLMTPGMSGAGRLIARKRDGRVRLLTRRGYDWTERYPRIREALATLRTASATIDGEAVICDGSGVAVFDRLHSRAYDDQALLYAFDLLELDGEDWRPRPLHERKARLAKLLAKVPAGIRYNDHLDGDGATIFAHACKLGLEGIVSKHREHPYRSGPSKAWLKIKNPIAPGVLRFKDDEP